MSLESKRRYGSVHLWLLALLVATACGPGVPSREPSAAEPGAAESDTTAPGATEAGPRVFTVIADNFEALKDHIILGTDAGAVGDFFGYADHVELALFVRMGMTPAEAIVAATGRSAQAFGLMDVGTLEAGMSADFIVLDANPLDDIENTRRISQVYLRGDRVDRDALRERWTR